MTNQQSFLDDVLEGMEKNPKAIPSQYHYDAKGFQLFEKILSQENYLLNQKEIGIFEQHLDQIVDMVKGHSTIIEFGCGHCKKIRPVLDQIKEPKTLILVDCFQPILTASSEEIQKLYPHFRVLPLLCNFTNFFDLPFHWKEEKTKKMGFFLGGTINNFTPNEAVVILKRFASVIRANGGLLLSVDLIKDNQAMIGAYSDPTSQEFYLNLFKRINRELEANFPLENLQHHCVYNLDKHCVQTYMKCTKSSELQIGKKTFYLDEGELIHTENSYKYSIQNIKYLIEQAEYLIQDIWQDKDQQQAIFSLTVKK